MTAIRSTAPKFRGLCQRCGQAPSNFGNRAKCADCDALVCVNCCVVVDRGRKRTDGRILVDRVCHPYCKELSDG